MELQLEQADLPRERRLGIEFVYRQTTKRLVARTRVDETGVLIDELRELRQAIDDANCLNGAKRGSALRSDMAVTPRAARGEGTLQ